MPLRLKNRKFVPKSAWARRRTASARRSLLEPIFCSKAPLVQDPVP